MTVFLVVKYCSPIYSIGTIGLERRERRKGDGVEGMREEKGQIDEGRESRGGMDEWRGEGKERWREKGDRLYNSTLNEIAQCSSGCGVGWDGDTGSAEATMHTRSCPYTEANLLKQLVLKQGFSNHQLGWPVRSWLAWFKNNYVGNQTLTSPTHTLFGCVCVSKLSRFILLSWEPAITLSLSQ